MVKDLLRIVKSDYPDRVQQNKSPTNFLQSLRHKQREPGFLFCKMIDSRLTIILISISHAQWLELYYTLHIVWNPFETAEYKTDSLQWNQYYPRHHDDELNAIEEKTRELRAQLEYLESEKSARVRQLNTWMDSDDTLFDGNVSFLTTVFNIAMNNNYVLYLYLYFTWICFHHSSQQITCVHLKNKEKNICINNKTAMSKLKAMNMWAKTFVTDIKCIMWWTRCCNSNIILQWYDQLLGTITYYFYFYIMYVWTDFYFYISSAWTQSHD